MHDEPPNVARTYDYLIGGNYSYPADRQLARELEVMDPGLRERARSSRMFTVEAVRRAADEGGIGQFLDLGCGFPGHPTVAEVARSVIPSARIAVIDSDRLPVEAWRDETRGDEGITAACADLTDTGAVLDAAGGLIDFAEPVCVLLCAVTHFLAADVAVGVAAAYMQVAAEGSWLVASSWHYSDPILLQQTRKAAPGGGFFNHGEEEFTALFAGLEPVRPGVSSVSAWMKNVQWIPLRREACVMCGIGEKSRPLRPGSEPQWRPACRFHRRRPLVPPCLPGGDRDGLEVIQPFRRLARCCCLLGRVPQGPAIACLRRPVDAPDSFPAFLSGTGPQRRVTAVERARLTLRHGCPTFVVVTRRALPPWGVRR